MRRRRWISFGGAALVLAAACLGAAAPPASAHAGLVASDPAAGAALGATPSAIRLTFSERIDPSLSRISIRSKRGIDYASGRAQPAPGDPLSLVIPVNPLPRGVYTVEYRVDSAVDGHDTTGAYGFGVGVSPALAGAAQPRTATPVSSPLEFLARWLFLVGLVALVGAVSAVLGGFGGPVGRGAPLALGGWITATAGLVLLADAQRANAGASFGTLLKTGVGHALIWRAVALGVAGAALVAGRLLPRARTPALAIAGLGALMAIVVHVANGHAAAAGSWPSGLTVASQAIHFSVAGVWIGGLAALLLGLRGEPAPAKAAALRRLSAIAGVGLLVVAGTGILRAFSELRSWGELFSTGYGRAVLAKLLLVGLIGIVGLRNRHRAELVLAAVALAVAALLGTLGPPVSVAYTGLRGLSASGVDPTKSIEVHLRTTSDQPGANSFAVTVDNAGSDGPVSGVAVSLRFTPLDDPGVGPTTLSLTPAGDGNYTGVGDNLRFDGRWGVLVVVRRGRGVAGAAGVPLELDTATPPQQTSIERIPGQPPKYSKLVGDLAIVRISPHPERAGPSDVYVTCYAVSLVGEQPIAGLVLTLATNGGPTRQQPVRRIGRGSFVAHLNLSKGDDEIAVIAHTRIGGRLRSVFGLNVPGG